MCGFFKYVQVMLAHHSLTHTFYRSAAVHNGQNSIMKVSLDIILQKSKTLYIPRL